MNTKFDNKKIMLFFYQQQVRIMTRKNNKDYMKDKEGKPC
jgi:hypothetical protein